MNNDLLSFLGGFQRPISYTTGLLGNIAQQLLQRKLHPTMEIGRNRVEVPAGGASGFTDAFGNFHWGVG
jgi:hypothetical protein